MQPTVVFQCSLQVDTWHGPTPVDTHANSCCVMHAGLRCCVAACLCLQALHSLGLRVVLDVVYNHTFASGPYSHNSVLVSWQN